MEDVPALAQIIIRLIIIEEHRDVGVDVVANRDGLLTERFFPVEVVDARREAWKMPGLTLEQKRPRLEVNYTCFSR
jgi:hypothetical protein